MIGLQQLRIQGYGDYRVYSQFRELGRDPGGLCLCSLVQSQSGDVYSVSSSLWSQGRERITVYSLVQGAGWKCVICPVDCTVKEQQLLKILGCPICVQQFSASKDGIILLCHVVECIRNRNITMCPVVWFSKLERSFSISIKKWLLFVQCRPLHLQWCE